MGISCMKFVDYINRHLLNESKFDADLTDAKYADEFNEFYKIDYASIDKLYPDISISDTRKVPYKVSRKDKESFVPSDTANMKTFIQLLKKNNQKYNFAGELSANHKFFIIDTYLK